MFASRQSCFSLSAFAALFIFILQLQEGRGIECVYCMDEDLKMKSYSQVVSRTPGATDDDAVITVVSSEITDDVANPPWQNGLAWAPPCKGNRMDELTVECPVDAMACFKMEGMEVRKADGEQGGNGTIYQVTRRGCISDAGFLGTSFEQKHYVLTGQVIFNQRVADGHCHDILTNGSLKINDTLDIDLPQKATFCMCTGERPHVEPDVESGDEPYTEWNAKQPCNQGTNHRFLWTLIGLMLIIALRPFQ